MCTCTFIIPSSPTTTKLSPYLSILSRICTSDILSVSKYKFCTVLEFYIFCRYFIFNLYRRSFLKFELLDFQQNCPSNDFNIPSYTKTNPLPPESTTPASFKACSSSGVLFNELLASFITKFS